MNVNRVNDTTFTGHAFKVKAPTKEIFQEAAGGMQTVGGAYVFIAKAGKKGDNALIKLLKQAKLGFRKSKNDYYDEFKAAGDRAMKRAAIEFDPEVAKMPDSEFKKPIYYIPGEY